MSPSKSPDNAPEPRQSRLRGLGRGKASKEDREAAADAEAAEWMRMLAPPGGDEALAGRTRGGPAAPARPDLDDDGPISAPPTVNGAPTIRVAPARDQIPGRGTRGSLGLRDGDSAPPDPPAVTGFRSRTAPRDAPTPPAAAPPAAAPPVRAVPPRDPMTDTSWPGRVIDGGLGAADLPPARPPAGGTDPRAGRSRFTEAAAGAAPADPTTTTGGRSRRRAADPSETSDPSSTGSFARQRFTTGGHDNTGDTADRHSGGHDRGSRHGTPAPGAAPTTFTPGASETPFGSSGSQAAFGGSGAAQSSFGSGASETAYGPGAAQSGFGPGGSEPAFGPAGSPPAFGPGASETSFGTGGSQPTFGPGASETAYGSGSDQPAFGPGASETAYGSGSAQATFGSGASQPTFGSGSAQPTYGPGAAETPFGSGAPEWPRHGRSDGPAGSSPWGTPAEPGRDRSDPDPGGYRLTAPGAPAGPDPWQALADQEASQSNSRGGRRSAADPRDGFGAGPDSRAQDGFRTGPDSRAGDGFRTGPDARVEDGFQADLGSRAGDGFRTGADTRAEDRRRESDNSYDRRRAAESPIFDRPTFTPPSFDPPLDFRSGRSDSRSSADAWSADVVAPRSGAAPDIRSTDGPRSAGVPDPRSGGATDGWSAGAPGYPDQRPADSRAGYRSEEQSDYDVFGGEPVPNLGYQPGPAYLPGRGPGSRRPADERTPPGRQPADERRPDGRAPSGGRAPADGRGSTARRGANDSRRLADGRGPIDSSGSTDGRGATDGRGQIDGRGATDGRGQIDGRGATDGRGRIDGSGAIDGRGQIDGRGATDGRGRIDGSGAIDGRGQIDGRGATDGRGLAGGPGGRGADALPINDPRKAGRRPDDRRRDPRALDDRGPDLYRPDDRRGPDRRGQDRRPGDRRNDPNRPADYRNDGYRDDHRPDDPDNDRRVGAGDANLAMAAAATERRRLGQRVAEVTGSTARVVDRSPETDSGRLQLGQIRRAQAKRKRKQLIAIVAVVAVVLVAAGIGAYLVLGGKGKSTPSSGPTAGGSPSGAVTPPADFGWPVKGNGQFGYATATSKAVGAAGTVHTFKVLTETGVDKAHGAVDPDDFADEVVKIVSDPKSWIASGKDRFQLVPKASTAAFVVELATETTTETLCAAGGFHTNKITSCVLPGKLIVNLTRWMEGADGFASIPAYRAYLVNHEIGRQLGHGNEACPGAGNNAPVMMEQTLDLQGCVANPYPYLDGKLYSGPKIP